MMQERVPHEATHTTGLPASTTSHEHTIADVDFSHATIEQLWWFSCTLTNCLFTSAHLWNVRSKGTAFIDCDFSKANLDWFSPIPNPEDRKPTEMHRCTFDRTKLIDIFF